MQPGAFAPDVVARGVAILHQVYTICSRSLDQTIVELGVNLLVCKKDLGEFNDCTTTRKPTVVDARFLRMLAVGTAT